MLPTEVQRILLLIGLAATAYLMILAWNDDFVKQDLSADYDAEPQLSTDTRTNLAPGPPPLTGSGGDAGPGPIGEPLVPVQPETSGNRDSDIPDPSLMERVGPQNQTMAPPADSGRLIKVSTPALQVWIDLQGGDIVRVQLPKYPLTMDRPDVPYLLLDNSRDHTYIAQSGLIGAKGLDSGGQRPLYRLESPTLELTGAGTLEVVLRSENTEFEITKTFLFHADTYLIDVRHALLNRSGAPVEAGLFAQIKRDGKDPYGETPFSLGPQPYVGAALTTPDSRYEKLTFSDLEEADYRTSVEGGWIAFLQHYFLSAWIGDSGETNRYYGQARSDGTYIVGYTSPARSVAQGSTGEWQSQFYAGPKKQKRLEEIAPNLNLTVDYGFLWWLAVPLFYILDWFHQFAGNWGISIILLTVLVKLVLYPLSAASYRSMANMRRVGPQMKRLQERYADDRQKLSQEMMNLYKKEGVNPLGGCLPMLLPMPIFIALYWVLFESVELRQAPFMLWIDDLAAMDPYFVLPLAMGASMFVQQLLSPAVGDPMQVKMMRLMPIMFTVLFLFFPAGLVLYWLVNNLLSIAQQWWIMRQVEEAQSAKT